VPSWYDSLLEVSKVLKSLHIELFCDNAFANISGHPLGLLHNIPEGWVKGAVARNLCSSIN
jgi:hypothetical protein